MSEKTNNIPEWSTRQRHRGSAPVRSLCWRGDELVDWVNGGSSWAPDGSFQPPALDLGTAGFDAALSDPTGRWSMVYERTGTKGLLLRDGKILREISRSDYKADAYMFPVCLFLGPEGRVLLAHCPEAYNQIEIEDAETGERLTRSKSRDPSDFFHSRLSSSPNGKRLLSAGWVWQPWDAVVFFDVATALSDPSSLDHGQGARDSLDVDFPEESSAAWLDDDQILLGSSGDEGCHEDGGLPPVGLAVYDLESCAYTQRVQLGYPPGAMMPVGLDHVLSFFQHPRLISLRSGRVVHEWPDLATGELISSIVWDRRSPAIALDAARARFAVADGNAVEVVTLNPALLPT